MSNDEPKDMFETNLAEMLRRAAPKTDAASDKRLEDAVLKAAADRRRARRARRRFLWPIFAGAAAAAGVVAFLAYHGQSGAIRKAGEVKAVYGIVTVANGSAPQEVSGTVTLADGQRIRTMWGSQAEIALADGSVLRAGPHTVLAAGDTPGGFKLTLEQGALSVSASKQPEGKSLRIETPGARIKVLGTRLDVFVTGANSLTKTEVCVNSGRVEITSAGKSLVLTPNINAVVYKGKPPVLRLVTPEIDELSRLAALAGIPAAPQGASCLRSAIVDFAPDGAADVWLAMEIANGTRAPVASWAFTGVRPFSGARAYSVEGLLLPVRVKDAAVEVDLGSQPVEPGKTSTVVLRLSGVEGLCDKRQGGLLVFDAASGGAASGTIVEFRLPEGARLVSVSPAPVETRDQNGRQVIIVAADARSIDVLR